MDRYEYVNPGVFKRQGSGEAEDLLRFEGIAGGGMRFTRDHQDYVRVAPPR